MGEEKKEAGEKQAEAKKNKAQKKKKTEEGKKPDPEGEKKSDDARKEKCKKDKQPQSPPLDIVLQVNIDCDGCSKKVHKYVTDVDGVDSVRLDREEKKVFVKGKADPLELRDEVKKRFRRKVELVPSVPEKPVEEPPKPERKKKKSRASSSKICLREEQGWIKMKKCNCEPAKFFVVKVSRKGWPYYKCDGCGEKPWVETNEFVRFYDLSVTVNNVNDGSNGETVAVVDMAELKARLAGLGELSSPEFKMLTLMYFVLLFMCVIYVMF